MAGGATLPGGSPVAGGPGAMPMGAGAGAGGGPPPAPPSGGAGESGDAFTPPPLDAKGNPLDDTKILKGKPKGLPPAPAMPPPPPKGADKVIPTDPSTGLPINEPDLPDPANVHPLNSQNAPGKTPAISARRRLL